MAVGCCNLFTVYRKEVAFCHELVRLTYRCLRQRCCYLFAEAHRFMRVVERAILGTRARARTQARTQARTHARTHARRAHCPRTQVQTTAHAHARVHAYANMHAQAHAHTHTHTKTRAHARARTCTRTRTGVWHTGLARCQGKGGDFLWRAPGGSSP